MACAPVTLIRLFRKGLGFDWDPHSMYDTFTGDGVTLDMTLDDLLKLASTHNANAKSITDAFSTVVWTSLSGFVSPSNSTVTEFIARLRSNESATYATEQRGEYTFIVEF